MKKRELKQKDIFPGKSYIRICKILDENLGFLFIFGVITTSLLQN